MATTPPRRPRLTRNIIEALRSVAADAAVMLDERAGTSSAFTTDERAYDGLEYLDALCAWYDATHSDPHPKPAPEPPVAESKHDPSCVLPNGHAGDCVPLSELADIDPKTGQIYSRGAIKAAQTRSERTDAAKKNQR